jgi:hypothetical protein
LFSGTFSGPIQWFKADGTYSLSGPLTGTLVGGINITGGSGTVQLTVNTTGFTGSTPISGGSTHVSFSTVTVPEPTSLTLLLVTGSLSLLGTLRRKMLVQ